MSKLSTSATEQLIAYVYAHGGRCEEWYAGITNCGERRVFDEHRVPKDGEVPYKWLTVESSSRARAIEAALHFVGFTGGGGGGDDTARIVYVYRKSRLTNP